MTAPTPDPEDPHFLAQFWRLIETGDVASLEPEDLRPAAEYLIGMVRGWLISYIGLARSLDAQQAEQAALQLISDQRAGYESLAATSSPAPGCPGPSAGAA